MLLPRSDRTFDRLYEITPTDLEKWRPPNLYWYGSTPKGDFPNLSATTPVVSDRAFEVMRPLIEKDVDRLQFNIPGGGYIGLHVRNIADCLDRENSEAVWFEPGRAMRIKQYAFRPERLAGQHLFRIPEYENGNAFLSAELMERLEDAGLKGLCRIKLWED
jgi:hypothetical protein